MYSRFNILLYVIIIGLFTASCTKKEKVAIIGTWRLISAEDMNGNSTIIPDSVDRLLKFNASSTEKTFSDNSLAAEFPIKGSWEKRKKELTIYFIDPDFSHPIDSIVLLNDQFGISSIVLEQDGNKKATITSEGVKFEPLDLSFTITEFDNEHLSLYNKNIGVFKYKRAIKEVQPYSFVSIARGLLGIAFLVGFAFLFSTDRKSIDWKLVGMGLLFQLVIAILVLKVPFVEGIFSWISGAFVKLIGFTNSGVDFLFGQMGIGTVQAPLITFAIKVLPTIIFFSALMSLLYYWGLLQKVVYAFAWLMKKFMNLSGAESLAAAGNVFLGQTESPLLVKPYLLGMTKSEIMCLMTGGMATIAGGVLAAYIGFLGGDDPVEQAFFAKHLLTASVISAPAAIVAAKILVPETEKFKEKIEVSKNKIGVNALEAITNGTTDGLKLAVNVGAMLLVFIAMMALANGILGKVGIIGGFNDWIAEVTDGRYDKLSFELIMGYACAPIVWMMGVDGADIVYVGELLGQKTILNEFVAYPRLGELKASGMINEKSIIMSTYMLCGFANIASIGIQIGGIGALIPTRKGLLSQLGVRALIGGTIACLLTAVVVGMTI